MGEATHKIPGGPGPSNNFPFFPLDIYSFWETQTNPRYIQKTKKKKKKKEGNDGHPQPLALSKLSTITIGGIRAMTP